MWWLWISAVLAAAPSSDFVRQGETVAEHAVVVVAAEEDGLRVVLNHRARGDLSFVLWRAAAAPDHHELTLVAGDPAAAAPVAAALQARLDALEAGPAPVVLVDALRDAAPAPAAPPPPGPALVSPRSSAAARSPWRVASWPQGGTGLGGAALLGALLSGLGWLGRGRRRRAARQGGSVLWWLVVPVLWWAMADALGPLDRPFSSDDQTQRIVAATLDLGAILDHRYADQRHPPLLFVLLHLVQRVGSSEALMRLPALAGALAAVPLLFGLLWRRAGGPAAAAAATALALNRDLLAHASEVGDHTLFVALSLLSSWLLVRALETGRGRVLLALGLAELAMLGASYNGLVVLGAHGLAVLLWGGRHRWWIVAILGLVLYGWNPELVRFVDLLGMDRAARETAAAYPAHMWGDLPVVGMLRAWLATLGPAPAAVDLLGLGVGAALVSGAWRRRPGPVVGVLALVLGLGLAAMVLAAPTVRMKSYYLLFLTPSLLGLATLGLARLPGALGALGGGALLGLVVHGSLTLHSAGGRLWTREVRADWKELGQRLGEAGAARVVADPNSAHTLLLYYTHTDPLGDYAGCVLADDGFGTRCLQGRPEIHTLTVIPKLTPGWEQEAVARLASLPPPLYFVGVGNFENAELQAMVEQDCRELERWPASGLSLHHCPAGVGRR